MNGQDFQGGRDTLVFEYVVPGRVASIRPTGADAGGGVLTHATADAPRAGGGGFAPASACTWFATDARGNVTSSVKLVDPTSWNVTYKILKFVRLDRLP